MTYDVYFNCEWVVRPLKTNTRGTGGAIMDIYSIVTDHDCQLILGDYTTWKVWADGCHVLPFIFRAPSEAEMQKCLNALQDYLQFSNFQPADEEDFVGNPHLFVLSAGTTGFVEDIEEMGEHNARILAGKGENL